MRVDLERDYDWYDDIPDLQVELEGRPVIIADVVRTSDGDVLTQQPSSVPTRILVATPGDIANVPARFFGRPVAVAAAEVEQAWSPRLFTLDEDRLFAGPDVLVFNPNPVSGLTAEGLDGEVVTVFGIVRPFLVSEFETDYDWFDAADYSATNLSPLERQPVIVASSITAPDRRELVQFSANLALDTAEQALAARRTGWTVLQEPAGTRPTASGADRGTPQAATSIQSSTQSATPGPAATSGQTSARPVRDVSALLVAGRDDVIGRRIVLDRVEIHEVMGSDTLLVGPSRVQMVAVRLSGAPPVMPQAGQHARIEGMVKRSPAGAAWKTPLYVDAQTFAIVR